MPCVFVRRQTPGFSTFFRSSNHTNQVPEGGIGCEINLDGCLPGGPFRAVSDCPRYKERKGGSTVPFHDGSGLARGGVLRPARTAAIPHRHLLKHSMKSSPGCAPPDGCPWDREQTHLSLRPFLIEEAYEALDALDRENARDLQRGIGAICCFKSCCMHRSQTEEGEFNIHQVIDGIGTKLIRRHPHVFSDFEVEDVSGVIHTWEAIKAEERQENGDSGKKGALDAFRSPYRALASRRDH